MVEASHAVGLVKRVFEPVEGSDLNGVRAGIVGSHGMNL